MSTIKLLVRRALWHDGISYPPDSVIAVDEATAARLLDGGRCELRDPRDAPRVKAARADELRKVMARAGPPTAHPGSPWQLGWPR